MAGSKSTYSERATLDLWLGASPITAVGTVYVILSTAAFSTSATGASCSEVSTSSTGYGRVAVSNNLTQWPAATGTNPASKGNANAVTYATATGSWGTVLSFYIVDAAVNGNILYGGDLSVSKTVSTGDSASFAGNALTVTEQ